MKKLIFILLPLLLLLGGGGAAAWYFFLRAPAAGESGVTLLPGVLLARYIGDSSEAAKRYFVELWRRLRPALAGREAVEPRIWRT